MVNFYDAGIKDILPCNLITPEAEAISYAVTQAMRRLQDFSESIKLYAALDKVPEEILDLIALEFGTQYYEQNLPKKKKEGLIAQTIKWYMHAGTPSVIEEFLGTVLEGGEIKEWYQYGGEPFYFKAWAWVGENEILLGYGAEVKHQICLYKNVRSWLEYFMFVIALGYKVTITYDLAIKFASKFYPRGNIAYLTLNGAWQLNANQKLDGYEIDYNFYPTYLQLSLSYPCNVYTAGLLIIKKEAITNSKMETTGIGIKPYFAVCDMAYPKLNIKAEHWTNIKVGITAITVINKLDGTWKLNKNKKLNGGQYKESGGTEMPVVKGIITKIGRKKLCEAHAGIRSLPKIAQIAWGDGGVESDGTPKKILGDETKLYNELMRKNSDDPLFVNEDHTTCRYSAQLEDMDLINKEISEIALYDVEGDMIAYQTFLRKGKDEGVPQRYDIDEIF